MAAAAKRSFSLPAEQSAFIDAQVAAGTFASASEVVRAGLRALQERDAAVERWLREEVGPTVQAVRAGRMKTHSATDVRQHLADQYAGANAKRKRAG